VFLELAVDSKWGILS